MFGETAVILLGPMRAGKSTIAGYLAEEYWFEKYSFADKLKALHHVTTGSLEKDREWLQTMGQSCRVVFGEDFWADRLVEQLMHDKPHRFVVDDARYANELSAIYRFSRENYERTKVGLVSISQEIAVQRGAEISLMHHESEKFARLLLNSADIESEVVFFGGVRIDIFDGSLPMKEYQRQIDDKLKISAYDDAKKTYFDLLSYSVQYPEQSEVEENVDG